jgi:hypothetical protein
VDECGFGTMRKKFKLIFNGSESCGKKCKQGFDGEYGGVWRRLRLAGVWNQVVGFFFFGAFGRNVEGNSHSRQLRRDTLLANFYVFNNLTELWRLFYRNRRNTTRNRRNKKCFHLKQDSKRGKINARVSVRYNIAFSFRNTSLISLKLF